MLLGADYQIGGTPVTFNIRRLTHEDTDAYRSFASRPLEDTPSSAFVSTAEEWRAHSLDWFKDRIS
jgi:hypothetical protein